MSDVYQSLAHSKWDASTMWYSCPNDGGKRSFGNIRRQLGPVFHALAKQKECQIVEGHLMPDHVHMCIAIPPKHPVASVIGFLGSAREFGELADWRGLGRFALPEVFRHRSQASAETPDTGGCPTPRLRGPSNSGNLWTGKRRQIFTTV